MKFVIKGRPISKKNSKNVGVNRYTNTIYFTSSKAWKRFEADAVDQLLKYDARFEGAIRVDYTFYFKGGMWVDLGNAIDGIDDILQLSGIIDNDKNIEAGGFVVNKGCKDWETIIEIQKL